MANNLNEDLNNRMVIVDAEYFKPEYHQPEFRVFHVQGGFGASPFTRGQAIFGEFVFDGEQARIEGFMVERFAEAYEVAAARRLREQKS